MGLLPRGGHGEKRRLIKGEGLRRESRPQTSQSRTARPPPHSPSGRPVSPERALPKGTVLPGSKPERSAPANTGRHRTEALLPPRIGCLPRSRPAGRGGCERGAARAPRFSQAGAPKVLSQDRELGQGAESTHALPSTSPAGTGGRPALPSRRLLDGSQALPFGASLVAHGGSREEQPRRRGTPAAAARLLVAPVVKAAPARSPVPRRAPAPSGTPALAEAVPCCHQVLFCSLEQLLLD